MSLATGSVTNTLSTPFTVGSNNVTSGGTSGALSSSAGDVNANTGGISGATGTQGSASSTIALDQGSGSSLSINQESPQAIAALAAGTQNALQSANLDVAEGFALSSKLGQTALNDAAAALTPADQRLYTAAAWIVGLVVAGIVLYMYLRR